MFQGFLTPVQCCAACGYDFADIQTGDGPAVFIMQISGLVVALLLLALQLMFRPPMWLLLVVGLLSVAGLALALMRPGKGLMIALQMRHGAGR